MADSKRDWLAITISLVSVIIAAGSAGYNILLHHDDIRVVMGNSLNVRREKQDFTLDRQQDLTFINSGNRPAVISEVYGKLVLARGTASDQSQCEENLSLAKNILLNASPIVIKPGEIQIWNAKVDVSYPWKLDGDVVRYHEDDAKEAAQKHIVCVEIYAATPDSSSFKWIQALYSLPALEEPKERIGKEVYKLPPVDFGPNALFGKDEPLKVLQHLHLGLR
jgi:hypothetical protein